MRTGRLHTERKLLGRVLIEKGIITEEKLNEALRIQAKTREMLGTILIRLGYTKEEDIARAIAEIFNIEYIDLYRTEIQDEAVLLVPGTFAYRHKILPIKVEDNNLYIVSDRPPEPQVVGNISRLTGRQIVVCISVNSLLGELLDEIYGKETVMRSTGGYYFRPGGSNPALVEIATEEAIDQNIIEILNNLISAALKDRASDIHFESGKDRLRIRFRIDGVLHDMETFPPEMTPSLVSRIKVLSNLDIAEKRAPQDGAFRFGNPPNEADIRVSVLPNIWGEKAVLRLLQPEGMKITLDGLGMEEDTLQTYLSLIRRPYGLILISGPTGSGKTTTLYASLLTLRSPEVNITTVEDPVEYKIDDITQVQVDAAEKITFAKALRFILRQDPDIVMVGEIRDKETADIALHASLTGHLVLSTIHTNDAPSALTRLIDMGCEPFLISSAVTGIIAQRLVRLNCEVCKETYEPTEAELRRLRLNGLPEGANWFRGKGCRRCQQTGYRGRIGIMELLKVDKEIRQAVVEGASSDRIREIAISKGMRVLFEDGLLKVHKGVTTPEEVLRVTMIEE
jgi:type IV pilus assembly protein PilB